ncbi:hypothetical protein [Oscillatoria sp. FACHB-1406]|uniref:hypothetical protein n=1 Tax=Oscillatoria sp. FACHB-1406 TaxID=2692846 RepID=UPI0016827332|nr:hypothetical protein [Oscillatoria sp. FACHB-1406]MBD2578896.1 hypothetical protein [Oscillatoria sp. FACHB-1406]
MNLKHPLFPLTLTVAALAIALPVRAQVIIIQNPNPVQGFPSQQPNSYINLSPIINNSPRISPILQPAYPSPYPTQRRYPAPSNTTVIVNPTVIVPGNRVYGYPYSYPSNSGFSVYYGSPNGVGIQVGY